jgi:hypothetical protein
MIYDFDVCSSVQYTPTEDADSVIEINIHQRKMSQIKRCAFIGANAC